MNAQAAPQAGPYEDLGRWIDAHHPEQIEFLREIVKVPSDTPPGDNAPAAEKAAALLTAMSFDVERHPVPEDFLRAYGMRSVTNLIVRQRFGSGGPTVALNAHGDVVPPGEGWTRPPYGGVIEDGRMYGRSISSPKVSGVHLKVSRTWSSPSTANIFALTLKHRASPHWSFSVASGNDRQYARMASTFISNSQQTNLS